MWVRGLKLMSFEGYERDVWVAPHVGAWIETYLCTVFSTKHRSHPMWVRGLKHEWRC